jgi:predicted component of type VI protein secretion system
VSESGKLDVDLWFSTILDFDPEQLISFGNYLPKLIENVNFNFRLMTIGCGAFCSDSDL